MAYEPLPSSPQTPAITPDVSVQVVRHNQICKKLQISSAKLFDMVARGHFPKPFTLVPGGRAVGWLEGDVDAWVLSRKAASR